jgi:hypothetical protein
MLPDVTGMAGVCHCTYLLVEVKFYKVFDWLALTTIIPSQFVK